MPTLKAVVLRAMGAALLVFSLTPVFRLVQPEEDAPVRTATLSMAEATVELVWWGSLTVLLLAVLLSRLFPGVPARLGRMVGAALSRPSRPVFAIVVAVAAAGAATVVTTVLFQGLLTNVDEMASSIHARFLAAGRLAGPAPVLPEGWLIPNMLIVPEGWVSQYPPSHLVVIAAFEALGAQLATGPVLFGAMAGIVALTLPRLVPDREPAMRAAAVLTAFSPMLVFLAGGMLSHLTAAAALVLTAYAALRARDGHAAWAILAGCAVGVAVSARPLTGLVLGTLFPVALWWPRVRAAGIGWGARRVVALVAGGLPFALALGAYHAQVFGSVTRWGYLAAFGADHGLGFHADPWGYDYGLREALALTSTDLVQLGVQLVETLLPVTAVVGAWLLVAPRIPRGAGLLVAWAFLPVVANGLYWFHAPRMYFEAAPAWVALAVLGLLVLTEPSTSTSSPSDDEASPPAGIPPDRNSGSSWLGLLSPFIGWTGVLAMVWAVGFGTPIRWSSYAWDDTTLASVRAPDAPAGPPALVFVHTAWTERIAATLQGAGGMRQDSVIIALRRNSTCVLHSYAVARDARARSGSEVPLPDIDLEWREGPPTSLSRRRTEAGSVIRALPDEDLPPACRRELDADRFGTVALAPLLWQGDLPGNEQGLPMFVRDLGPTKNARIRAAHPDRSPFVFVPRAVGAPPELVPYEEAMGLLWGGR